MSARERSLPEQLAARERQVCQAAGLRELADLIESNERVSAVLADALAYFAVHLAGADRTDDLRHFDDASYWAGAVIIRNNLAYGDAAFRVVHAAWSRHFQVHLQCSAPKTTEQPVTGATEFATGDHDRGIQP